MKTTIKTSKFPVWPKIVVDGGRLWLPPPQPNDDADDVDDDDTIYRYGRKFISK